MLHGRRSECEALGGLVEGLRGGRGSVLVLRGEAGAGKTALLDYLAEPAADLRMVRSAGVEPEMDLAFAGLQRLCGPVLDRLGQLPVPQRDALRTAFGLAAGAAADRFLVGLAALSLLSDAATERPLVCVIDDAQWLDQASAQALAFVARRLRTERVLMLFAAREPRAELAGLPELTVEGLRDADARELLGSLIRWPLDERVAKQIVADTRGNPLALLELARGLSPAELAGGFGLPEVLPLPARIEDSFLRRAKNLPEPSWRLLVVAAAETAGDPVVVWRAARRLGIPAQAAVPAAQVGLLELGARVRFRHPLVRSAAYRSASLHDRRAVHRALAEVIDPLLHPDRRAWHLAQAAPGAGRVVAASAVRRPGSGARGPGRSRRLSRARGGADAGPGAAGRPGAHQRRRHRLGARHRGPLAGAAGRRRAGRPAVPGGDPATAAPGSGRNWPARTWSTANGCAARSAAWTHASSSGPPTRCCPRWEPMGSPNGPGVSCWPPARRCASAPPRRSLR